MSISLHERVKGGAEKVKITIQMGIGLMIVLTLCMKLLYVTAQMIPALPLLSYLPPYLSLVNNILQLPTLEIVGRGLSYSAGVELAYMLFTPGPDEAIEPLILGLAAALLLSVSKIKDPNISLALEIGLYVLILAGLFFLRQIFIVNGGRIILPASNLENPPSAFASKEIVSASSMANESSHRTPRLRASHVMLLLFAWMLRARRR